MQTIAAIILCSNVFLGGAVYWQLPVLPEVPETIQPLPNQSDCGFFWHHTLPEILNTLELFPERGHYRNIIAANAGIMTTTTTMNYLDVYRNMLARNAIATPTAPITTMQGNLTIPTRLLDFLVVPRDGLDFRNALTQYGKTDAQSFTTTTSTTSSAPHNSMSIDVGGPGSSWAPGGFQ